MKHFLLISLIILLGGSPIYIGLHIGKDTIKFRPLITDETMMTKWKNNPYYLRVRVFLPRGVYTSILWADEEDRIYTYNNIHKSDSSTIYVNNCELGVFGKSYYNNEMHALYPDIFMTVEEYSSKLDTSWVSNNKFYRKVRVGDVTYGYKYVAFDKVDLFNRCLDACMIDTVYFNSKKVRLLYF